MEMIRAIHQFINRLQTTASPMALAEYWQNTLEYLGFSQFALTMYDHELKPAGSDYDVVTPNLLNWHQHFHRQQYDADDDIAHTVKQNRIPLLWDLASQTTTHPRMQQMISEALDYGLSAGISLTIPTEQHHFGILVLHAADSASRYQTSPELIFAIQAITSLYCEKRLCFDNAAQFTAREIQILQLAIRYSAAEIATHIHRSERTVIFHLNNIKTKLGAKTKTEAIYLALKRNLIH